MQYPLPSYHLTYRMYTYIHTHICIHTYIHTRVCVYVRHCARAHDYVRSFAAKGRAWTAWLTYTDLGQACTKKVEQASTFSQHSR